MFGTFKYVNNIDACLRIGMSCYTVSDKNPIRIIFNMNVKIVTKDDLHQIKMD